MEFIGRIFFPKANNSSEENSKEENQQEDREDDFYDDGSYDPRRVDLANMIRVNGRSGSRQTMMSEREVREIMHQYNGSIDNFTKEIFTLKAKCRDLDDELLMLRRQTIQIEEKNRDVKHKLHNSYAEKEKVRLKISDIENSINLIQESNISYNEPVDMTILKTTLMENLPQMLPESEDYLKSSELIDEIFTNYMACQYRLEKLKEKNKEFASKIDEEKIIEDIQNNFILPVTINESKSPSSEHKKCWHFHPGKLRFYSCKGCGRDEYYQCCLLCSKCSPGCREMRQSNE